MHKIRNVLNCRVPSLTRSKLKVSAHIVHYSKVLLKLNLKLIRLPLLCLYVTEVVDGREELGELLHVQVNMAGSMGKECKTGHPSA